MPFRQGCPSIIGGCAPVGQSPKNSKSLLTAGQMRGPHAGSPRGVLVHRPTSGGEAVTSRSLKAAPPPPQLGQKHLSALVKP